MRKCAEYRRSRISCVRARHGGTAPRLDLEVIDALEQATTEMPLDA
jgi:hypothetical protein